MDRRFRIGPPMTPMSYGCVWYAAIVLVLGAVFVLEVLPRLSLIWMAIHGR